MGATAQDIDGLKGVKMQRRMAGEQDAPDTSAKALLRKDPHVAAHCSALVTVAMQLGAAVTELNLRLPKQPSDQVRNPIAR